MVCVFRFGGRDITDYITRQLRKSTGMALNTMAEREVVRQMKEQLCYCGQPKDEGVNEVSKQADRTTIVTSFFFCAHQHRHLTRLLCTTTIIVLHFIPWY